ncbi:head-tail connector protein [Thetidibacter halocola]|uniref:Head-tail connector protein n=1 Tax=Thetidibacter halocola TaxID=2827239 RepID=A0A8J7WFS3_9RHOB|nr:head-tail connector protein [Thetidibacter halocola]MBS0124243.1 head-tail connector protein [Thetidibacter halocola]
MILVEETQVPEAALPVDALKQHLRLGSGFAEDDVQDAVLASFLRAAMAAVEARCSSVLIARRFVLTVHVWRDGEGQVLPVAPVSAIADVTIVDAYGVETVISPARYRLQKDSFTPRLRPVGMSLPTIPSGGSAEIRFDAGYGPAFDDVPADLRQAVLLLAAHYYEYRDETALSQGCMPFGVTALLQRYRPVRLGLGA